MASIKRYKVLLDQSAAGDGEWFRLDNRYDTNTERVIQVDLTAGDTIELQGVTKDVRGGNPTTVIASIEADDISTIQTYTEDNTGDVLSGPWTYIRVVKTGAAGNSKVSGFI